MGWFWSSSENKGSEESKDPVGSLDPSLRDFLQRESSVKYGPANTPAGSLETNTDQQSSSQTPKQQEAADDSVTPAPPVPPQSLFADGRYAHLWRTYQPLSEIEHRNKTEQDRLLDILESHKLRKAEIGRAALENCALEQWSVNDCFRNGSWASRMTMCRKENRELQRCYTMQSKFLKALGYLSNFDRAPEVDEQIQMHADKLYHQMLEQESIVEQAKADGRPAPVFEPILSSPDQNGNHKKPSTLATMSPKPTMTVDQFSPDARAQLRKRLEGLTDEERELEEKAIAGEIAAGEQLAGRLTDIYNEQKRARLERKEQGKQTLEDSIRGLFGR
ncbi:hypothetical protein GP486_003680 [Trichoglossum hirsutum]|uniref:Autophagy protein n=1 Tax=Trichoglossum hirsutum TaxID=265104 RepID=A0A9P8LCG6_9PEZI|nr:hypothetical protein GP486_003680 [Trichoglossum hirsutum]